MQVRSGSKYLSVVKKSERDTSKKRIMMDELKIGCGFAGIVLGAYILIRLACALLGIEIDWNA